MSIVKIYDKYLHDCTDYMLTSAIYYINSELKKRRKIEKEKNHIDELVEIFKKPVECKIFKFNKER